jgi:fibronectin-binding autotransporter adhesin
MNFFNLDLTGATNTIFTNYTMSVAGSFNAGSQTSAGTNYLFQYTGSNQSVAAFNYFNLSLTGTGTTFANGTIGIGNSFSAGSITSANQGTISFNNVNATVPNFTFYGLTFNGAGTMFLNTGTSLTVNGPFTLASGTNLSLNGQTATIWNIAGGLNFSGTGGQNIQYLTLNLLNSGNLSGVGAGSTPNVTIASGATYTQTGNFGMTSGSTLTINGTLAAANYQITGTGAILLNSSGQVSVSGASGIIGMIGNTGGYTFSAGAKYLFNGTSAQSTGFSGVTMAGAPSAITVSNSNADVTLDADITLANSGQFIINSNGRFDAGTRVISFGTGGMATITGTIRTANLNGFSGASNSTFSNTNSPAITLASGSMVAYTASSAQVVTSRNDYHHITLSNGQKSLAAATSIAGSVTLNGNSKLLLGANNLSVGGTMSGDASNYVITDGAGAVVLRSVTGSGKQFIIGASTSSYSPLTIAQGSSLDWTVKVEAGITPSIASSAESIQRMWTITPSTNPTVTAATLTFQYNEADAGIKGANWNTASNVALKRHNGTAWVSFSGNIAPGGTAGGIRTATATGMKQFSPWIVGTGGATLPVNLLSFSGSHENTANVLRWTTAQEINNAGFTLERSADGQRYSTLTTIASRGAGGNSATPLSYRFDDNTVTGSRNYYRLRQTDWNGSSRYSAVVLVRSSEQSPLLSGLYLAGSQLQGQLTTGEAMRGRLMVFDAQGRTVVVREQHFGTGSNAVSIDLGMIPPGAYLLRVELENGDSSAVRFIKP